MKPIIAVIGGSTSTEQESALAEQTGRLLAQRGAIVLCGGLGGVMEAVAKGVQANGGTTVGILGTPVVGLHDAFGADLDIPRMQTAEEAVAWAFSHAVR